MRMETGNLFLRKAVFEDWKPMYHNVWSRVETARYMVWQGSVDEKSARERIQKTIAHQSGHDAWVICEKGSGEPIGFAGVEEMQNHIFTDTDIAIGPEYIGKGYGKQVLLLLMEYCRSRGGKEFVYTTRKENAASRALALSCGFTYRGSKQKTSPKDGEVYELEIYSKELRMPEHMG